MPAVVLVAVILKLTVRTVFVVARVVRDWLCRGSLHRRSDAIGHEVSQRHVANWNPVRSGIGSRHLGRCGSDRSCQREANHDPTR